MTTSISRWRRAGAATALVAALSGCAAAGSQESDGPLMTNAGDVAVSVRTADGEVSDIEPDGGVLVLGDDCLEAPLVVTYAGGEKTTVDDPLCPGQELVIGDGAVRLVEPPHG